MMHMTFYWGKKVTLLFDSWKTDSWTSYGLTLLAIFIASVFYQYLEDRRLRFKALSRSKPSLPSDESPFFLLGYAGGGNRSPARFASAILFGINSAIGYMLMLAVMSFNWGVFIAVVVGLAIGYLFFRTGDEVVIVDNACACA
ncbi:Copper transporter 5.1 [Acorus gramineus]|uniref:Copper transport protein n=1 Tax=Acorus gramineus TaxID=55184 RepID=A0AAV9BTA3_ACOGR|nr:Copper transporter 5.1 [Acorus gramineus]